MFIIALPSQLVLSFSPNLVRSFIAGLILPLSFAPFHIPGIAIFSIAILYAQLIRRKAQPFLTGLVFGLGYFGLGISWVFVSMHEYGHLNYLLSFLITTGFLIYLSLFIACISSLFVKLTTVKFINHNAGLFSALWTLGEYARATLFTGFPWLLLGFGQFDTSAKYLLPIIGSYGVSFFTCIAATLLVQAINHTGLRSFFILSCFVLLLVFPSFLTHKQWTHKESKLISIGVIQANLAMRDKWDEHLFWHLLKQYHNETVKLLGTDLIVMPESAIPVPRHFVADFLNKMHRQAKLAHSTIILGIPQASKKNEFNYFNALISLGNGHGVYLKQHLVPFGEYIPKILLKISELLALPAVNLIPGLKNQTLVKVQHHAIATLICYELAYGDLLRQQLPQAKWIVSISDDGWFGHSLAMYQQLQIAQVRSMETGRYQVIANNDGLSSVINDQGEIIAMLPAFHSGILKTQLSPISGVTPWVVLGDKPIILICFFIVLCYSIFYILELIKKLLYKVNSNIAAAKEPSGL